MERNIFVTAEELSKMLEISKPYAYKIIKQMNSELREKGFITISGKVSRRYLEEKFYGMGEDIHACV